MKRIMVTGGAGFIGSALVRRLAADETCEILNVDKLTYAANLSSLTGAAASPRHRLLEADICDAEAMGAAYAGFAPDAVMHLAAESHVDRSIDAPDAFIQSNIVGTYTLLDEARRHLDARDAEARARFRFVHVSTDEVFGDLGPEGAFTEESPYRPHSPYAASKAAADHLVRAWARTFGLPVLISNCSNNYGPYQFPEKLIPLVIIKCLTHSDIPVYGDGGQVRDWLHVDDHVDALLTILERGAVGESYNVGGDGERTNIQLVRTICDILDQIHPSSDGPYRELIGFVPDRPGHDRRYAMDHAKLTRELGWTPQRTLESGLEETVRWYLDNRSWWETIHHGAYGGQRLGLASAGAR